MVLLFDGYYTPCMHMHKEKAENTGAAIQSSTHSGEKTSTSTTVIKNAMQDADEGKYICLRRKQLQGTKAELARISSTDYRSKADVKRALAARRPAEKDTESKAESVLLLQEIKEGEACDIS